MNVDEYLERIGYAGPREPTAETLRRLHRAHLLAVPFENLDIHLGDPIVLSLPALCDKIVRRRRGGFCYELNGSFAWLLEQLGFRVTMLSGRVFDGERAGPEFDHLVLRVEAEESLIADVGFGDSFLEPLPLEAGEVSEQHGSGYRLSSAGADRILERRTDDSGWKPQYVFTLIPRRLVEFEAMCVHHQTSPESIFTRKVVCSRATADGRITLSNGRLISTMGGLREEREVAGESDYRTLLGLHFGIGLDTEARIDRLLLGGTPSR